MDYNTLKALHIIFIISWFAGLFYLPRIFVNLAMVPAESKAEKERLLRMAEKLFRFMSPLGALAVVFGLWLWFYFDLSGFWLYFKATVTVVLTLYNAYCGVIIRQFRENKSERSHVWFRWFNELPTFIMFATVFVAVLKPYQFW
ncbi:MAG: CopD family protein [Zoogloeaceae bacterium]|jgi:putative membrane protein|nr:CopD family protein [Zoogloeaceae bacterium]